MITKTNNNVHFTARNPGQKNGLAFAVLLASLIMMSGCTSVKVFSEPLGARVLVDGVDTGKTTPTSLWVRSLPVGISTVTVEKENYHCPMKQDVGVSVSVGNIIFSWWPPLLIKNISDNTWKSFDYPTNGELKVFEMVEDKCPSPPRR